MAGFRIGRGRDNRAPQARPQQPPRQQPYARSRPATGRAVVRLPVRAVSSSRSGGSAYGGGHGRPQPDGGAAAGGGPGHGSGGHGEPEYFGDRRSTRPAAGAPDPYAANNPGHTQAFSSATTRTTRATPTARAAAAPPAGPRLHWKELLRGIVLRPRPTFLQMRDYTMWGPALIVTFLYGLLAVFGFDGAREDAINATLSNADPDRPDDGRRHRPQRPSSWAWSPTPWPASSAATAPGSRRSASPC